MSFLSSFGQSKQSPDWSFGNLPTTSAAPAQQSTGAFGIGISGAATNTTTGNNTTAQGQQQQAFPTPGGLFSNVGNAARSTAQPAPFSLNATAGQQANPFASASQPSQQQQQPALFNTNPLSNSFFTQQSNAGGLLGGNAMNQPVSQLPNATEVAGGFDPSRGPLQVIRQLSTCDVAKRAS